MARYTGPTTKIARKFGEPIFGSDKNFEKRNYPPGQHGLASKRKKQKVRYMYGLLERQFHNTYLKATRMSGQRGENLLFLLESRLDGIEAAAIVGKAIAERAKEKGIDKVSFDRGGYLYHGRVKSLADGAREGGLIF